MQTDPTADNLREILTLASRCPVEQSIKIPTRTLPRIIPEPKAQLDESMDEFSTNFADVAESESSFVEKNDLKKNMKTKVQFDLETCEFSELLVPATPARIDISSPMKPLSQSSQESETKSPEKSTELPENIQKCLGVTKESEETPSSSAKSHTVAETSQKLDALEKIKSLEKSNTGLSNISKTAELDIQSEESSDKNLTKISTINSMDALPKTTQDDKSLDIAENSKKNSPLRNATQIDESQVEVTKSKATEEVLTVSNENTAKIMLSQEENESPIKISEVHTVPEPKSKKSKMKTRAANKDRGGSKAPDDR